MEEAAIDRGLDGCMSLWQQREGGLCTKNWNVSWQVLRATHKCQDVLLGRDGCWLLPSLYSPSTSALPSMG